MVSVPTGGHAVCETQPYFQEIRQEWPEGPDTDWTPTGCSQSPRLPSELPRGGRGPHSCRAENSRELVGSACPPKLILRTREGPPLMGHSHVQRPQSVPRSKVTLPFISKCSKAGLNLLNTGGRGKAAKPGEADTGH